MRNLLLFVAAYAAALPALGQVLTLDEARRPALDAQPALRALDLNVRALEAIALASGKTSQAEVVAARQSLSQSNDRRLELVAQARRARSALARWIPDSASRELPAELPAFAVPAPLETIAASLEHHPQHAMHLRALGVAEADVALAREASQPDRSVEFGYFARSGGRSDMLMFQLAIELPVYADRKQERVLA